MILIRWIALGISLAVVMRVSAQDTSAEPSSAPSEPAPTTSPVPGPISEPGTGAASTFTTPATTDTTGGLGATGGGEPSSTPATPGLGEGFGATKAPSSAPTFTLPGFYGASATTFTAGQGRLARPRFRYNVSTAVGYDDNVLQAPTERGPVQEFLVSLPTPDTIEPIFENRIRIGQGGQREVVQVVTGFRTVKGKAAEFETIQPQERVGSFFARAAGGLDIQLYSARSLFTFDLHGSADHYFSRPSDRSTDYTGGLSVSYLYRVTPRMQVTAQVSASYLTEPDFSRINSSAAINAGAYITYSSRFDLSYRWAPRFTTLLSLSDGGLFYDDEQLAGSNYNDTTAGAEFRFLWSPRFTALAELRASMTAYPDNPILDSHTYYLLLGAEFKLTQRLGATLRLGESVRSFDEGETGAASTPYVETNVAYRLAIGTVVNWNARFGFEEPFAPGVERVVFRSGISLAQVFSARLNGFLSLNVAHETSTQEGVNSESTSDYFDANLRFEYAITKRFSLNATYSYSQRATSFKVSDFYRNRIFLGAEYTF